MPYILGYSVRSSGRDLNAVRRVRRVAPVVVEQPAVVKTEPALDEMLKSDLVSLAESTGVDSSGTKADILARLGSVR
jgi:hypothetical protein